MHCAGGYRSMIAASILKSNGIHNFIDIKGGFNALKERLGISVKQVLKIQNKEYINIGYYNTDQLYYLNEDINCYSFSDKRLTNDNMIVFFVILFYKLIIIRILWVLTNLNL